MSKVLYHMESIFPEAGIRIRLFSLCRRVYMEKPNSFVHPIKYKKWKYKFYILKTYIHENIESSSLKWQEATQIETKQAGQSTINVMDSKGTRYVVKSVSAHEFAMKINLQNTENKKHFPEINTHLSGLNEIRAMVRLPVSLGFPICDDTSPYGVVVFVYVWAPSGLPGSIPFGNHFFSDFFKIP